MKANERKVSLKSSKYPEKTLYLTIHVGWPTGDNIMSPVWKNSE